MILTGDEGSSGTAAASFISGEWNNIFITSWFSFPSLFSFLQSLSIRVLGRTTEALRLVSAIAGALTVGCVYLVGRRLFGPRAGTFAALILAALHFHIHFSRIGLNNIWDGLWFTLGVGALCIGWEFNKHWGYLIAGLALGFGQYFYVSSRGLFGVLLAGLVFALVSQRQRLKEALPSIVLMLVAATVVILPLAAFYIEQANQYLAPMARVSFLNSIQQSVQLSGEPAWLILFKRFAAGMQAYTVTPVAFWYQPETPILRPVFAAFFYLGAVILLLKYEDSRSLLLLWLLSFGVIAGLSDSAIPAAQRYVAAAPACALLAGLGLHGTTEMLETLWQKYRRVFARFSVLLLVAAMTSDVYFYYVDYYDKDLRNNMRSDGTVAQHVADLVMDEPEGTQVAFFNQSGGMGYYSIPSIQYLAPQVKGIDVFDPWSSFDKTSLNGSHLIFIVLPNRQDDIPTIEVQYPGGQLDSEIAWNGEVLFWVYEIP